MGSHIASTLAILAILTVVSLPELWSMPFLQIVAAFHATSVITLALIVFLLICA